MSTQSSTIQHSQKHERLVIVGSTLGTPFEWYDFFLFGAVASVFSRLFFAPLSPSRAYLFALIAFGVGVAVRPLGALLFGRLGDLIGRKYTFLITIVLMGGATFCVGLFPTYEQVGILAPILLLLLRVVQGLGLGGEYGGAAIYVAEHASPGRKGRNTNWTQMTGAGGCVSAAPTADGRDTWLPTMRHIALEGRCFVLSSNQFARRSDYPADYPAFQDQPQDGIVSVGGSCIVDPLGNVIAGPNFTEETIVVAEIDLDDIPRAKYDLDAVGHYSRPDVFRLLVNENSQPSIDSGYSLFPASESK